MERGNSEPYRTQENSSLVRKINRQDKKSIILLANSSLNEKAVCNPSIWGNHFIYRVREVADNRYGERSITKYQSLISPYKLSGEPRTILVPKFEWEKDGIEDARISRNGAYHIVYVAFNEDPRDGGARIALANTDDFKVIRKEGIIGSPVRLEEGIQLVGGPDSYYGKQFQDTLKSMRKKHPEINPYIMDKDATIVYNNKGNPILLHRMGDSIQATPFSTIEDLKNGDFWRWKMSELEEDTILHPGERWASEKVGLGGTPINIEGRIIGHVHGVRKTKEGKRTIFIYNSTFAEFDPETYKIISILRTPPLRPNKEFILTEQNEEEIVEKYINFASGMSIDPAEDPVICNYSGLGDRGIELRTNNLKQWLWGELSNPHNKIENWRKNKAA